MNIIFLDLDGPMFPDRVIRYHPDNRKPYPGADKEFGETLTYWRMCETSRNFWSHINQCFDFEVVISSSWRRFYNDPTVFIDLFSTNDLPLKLHEDWRSRYLNQKMTDYKCYRADEIHAWLLDHPLVKNFLILDDPESGSSLDDSLCHGNFDETHNYMKENIILVNPDMGLSSYNMKKIIELMKKW